MIACLNVGEYASRHPRRFLVASGIPRDRGTCRYGLVGLGTKVYVYTFVFILVLFSIPSFAAGEKASESNHAVQKLEDITDQLKMETILEDSFEYTYAAFGRPDPFIPNIHPSHQPSVSVAITSILQRYPLDRIRVVGIWQLQNGGRKSLMMTEKSEGVVVALGDSVGIHGGKISKIESDHVVIREFTLDSKGIQHFADRAIWLGSREEKKPDKSLTIQSDSYPEEVEAKVTEPASAVVPSDTTIKK